MLLDEIKQYLHANLSKKRTEHIQRVKQTALELSTFYKLTKQEIEKVKIAALCHDIIKEKKPETITEFIIFQQRKSTELYTQYPSTWHALMCGEFIKKKFNITDTHIIEAVNYHCTGRAKLSIISKIIYISDYIEPKRNIENRETITITSHHNLNQAMYIISKQMLRKLKKSTNNIHPLSIKCHNWYKKINKTK